MIFLKKSQNNYKTLFIDKLFNKRNLKLERKED